MLDEIQVNLPLITQFMAGIFTCLRDKHAFWYKTFLVCLCTIFIVWLLPKHGDFASDYSNLKGKPWNFESLIAPYDFPIYKTTEEYTKERKLVQEESKLYYTNDVTIAKLKTDAFKKFHEATEKQLFLLGKPILDSLYYRGVIEGNDSLLNKTTNYNIIVQYDGVAEEKKKGDFLTLKQADEYIINKVTKLNYPAKEKLINTIEDYLVHNITFNTQLTEKLLEQDLENVLPTRDKIVKGQIIINRGEIVTDEKFNILSSLQNEENQQTGKDLNFFLLVLGQTLFVALGMMMVFLYLAIFRKNIFSQNPHVSFIFITIAFFMFVSKEVFLYKSISLYVIPFAIAPIIIRAFFDTRTALFTHLNIIFLASFFVNDRFEFVFIQLFAGIAAIFTIANMTTRFQLLLTGVVVFITYAVSYSAVTLLVEAKMQNISFGNYSNFALSSLLLLVAYPAIFLIEKLFGFISDFTLLELADSNNVLLRSLATGAPGTFQHSIQVASLAEEAIQKIGGNPLLVRAGAMYHDIGKLDNPRFFTENQIAGANPHEDISYEESARIIIGHVIKGIEKAKEHRLPDQVIDFIRTHHGTSHTGYFYKKSINEFGVKNVDESKFKYPGPIPYSKETAALMMADSVEAASRSLKTYDAVSIDELVERIINNQIEEQQFINADITFRDIHTVKKIFKKRLMNIYHVRIEYPR